MAALPDPVAPQTHAQGDDSAIVRRLAVLADRTGFDVVDLAGFFDEVERHAQDQKSGIDAAREGASEIEAANQRVMEAVSSVADASLSTLEKVKTSAASIAGSLDTTREMADWVASIDGRIAKLDESLEAIVKSNAQITTIAKQVNILAINATIEAARAGDAGRGFAVVADAIKDLSRQTARAAEGIGDSISSLGAWTSAMREDAQTTAEQTAHLVEAADVTNAALSEIAQATEQTHSDADQISARARDVEAATTAFALPFKTIETSAHAVGSGVTDAHRRLEGMVDTCEGIVQATAQLGADTPDSLFIAATMDMAAQVADAFEDALETQAITLEALFSTTLNPIAGTNPPQHIAPFTALTDRLLPPILESALSVDDRVAFCAAVTRTGYLPTHNKKFSKPQGSDPTWNASHSRNRRIFNDRVGLKAGQNTAPFLLQVYRRDMGQDGFIMMKDLAVPITVAGRHWGGLRMGYKP